jgi:adenylate cyclase
MRGLGVVSVSLAIAAALAALRLAAPVPVEVVDRKLLDFRHAVRGPIPAGGEVAIVGIDEASLAQVGRWPWPRSRIAALIDALSDAGAAVVGFDVVFDEPESAIDFSALQAAVIAHPNRPAIDLPDVLRREYDQDAHLADAMRRSGRVVLGHFFEFTGERSPTLAADVARLPELSVATLGGATPHLLKEATRALVDIPVLTAAASGAGHINFIPDPDGFYRRLPIAIRAGDRLLPSLSLEVLRRYLGESSATITLAPDGVVGVRVGRVDVPVDGAGQLWLDYLGPPGTVRQFSAADVLAKRLPPGVLDGKIVLVGFTSSGFDEVPTPFTAVSPGIELQATLVDNMLHGLSLRRPWWVVPGEAAIVLGIGLTIGLALRWLSIRWSAVIAVALLALYAWGTQTMFERAGLAMGGVYPAGAVLLCTLGGAIFQAATEEREKRKIRQAFQLYVNPEVADMLAREPSRLRLGGERREITVLFSDIRGFTTLAESIEPEVLGELLNEYLGAMTDIVFQHEGLLDKYIGDAVMAFWGAPVPAADHAARCCRAALDMLAELARLHEHWRAANRPLLQIGIGIHSGPAIVGNFGSTRRFNYTGVGDSVNLASRLEGLTPRYGVGIMISEDTRRLVEGEFVCREIDRVVVKGRVQPVRVHELLARRADDQDGSMAARAAAFENALAAVRRGEWDAALAGLEGLAGTQASDRAVAGLLARCQSMREEALAARAR